MQKTFLSVVALAALTSSALAADLPSRPMAPPPPVFAAPPVFTWSGFYVGANVGGAWGNGFDDENPYGGTFPRGANCCEAASLLAGGVAGFGPVGGLNEAALRAALAAQNRAVNFRDGSGGLTRFGDSDDDVSLTGGAQIGYNVQVGALVFGVEGDINFIGDRGRGFGGFSTGSFDFAGEFFPNAGTLRFAPGEGGRPVLVEVLNDRAGPSGTSYNGTVDTSGNGHSDWLATVRGRLGFAFDRLLVYGTGGVAFQDGGGTTTTTTLNRVDCRPDVIAGATGRVPGACATTSTTYGSVSGRRNDVGWAAGVGIEYAAFSNVSLGIEYLHADFGDYTVAFVDPVLTAAADRRISAVPVNNTSFATLRNPTTRNPGAAPAPVVTRVRSDDSVDLVRFKVNVRF